MTSYQPVELEITTATGIETGFESRPLEGGAWHIRQANRTGYCFYVELMPDLRGAVWELLADTPIDQAVSDAAGFAIADARAQKSEPALGEDFHVLVGQEHLQEAGHLPHPRRGSSIAARASTLDRERH